MRCRSSAGPAPGAKPRVVRKASLRTGLIMTHDDELVRAVKKKDRGALERLAERMGPGHLGEALHRPDPAVVEAALVALPLTRGAVLEIGAVTDLLESSNAALAAAAARVLGQLLDGAEPGALDDWEVPPDMVERACNGLRGLATRADAAVTARVAAISAVASASMLCPAASGELASLLRDPVPAVRRATALVLRPEERRANGALRDVVRDPERLVVSAAVATLCRDEPADGSGAGAPVKTDAPAVAGGRAGAASWRRRAGRRPPTPSRCSAVSRAPPRPPTSRSWISCAAGRRRRCAIARPS